MTAHDYRAALNAAIVEYETLGEQRRQVDARLSQLAETISTLCRLLGLKSTVPLGLTDAVRLVYRNAGVPLSPTDARNRLRGMGFDLSIYSNDMAAIHTVLKRLNEAGELKFVGTSGKHIYRWMPPVTALAIGPEVAQFLRESGTFHTDSPPPKRKRKR